MDHTSRFSYLLQNTTFNTTDLSRESFPVSMATDLLIFRKHYSDMRMKGARRVFRLLLLSAIALLCWSHLSRVWNAGEEEPTPRVTIGMAVRLPVFNILNDGTPHGKQFVKDTHRHVIVNSRQHSAQFLEDMYGNAVENRTEKIAYLKVGTNNQRVSPQPRVIRSVKMTISGQIKTNSTNFNQASKERLYDSNIHKTATVFKHGFRLVPASCDTMEELNGSLLILVNSAAHHFDRREAIRNTWARAAVTNTWYPDSLRSQTLTRKVRVTFILGLDPDYDTNLRIQSEGLRYQDIVQGEFKDHYRNLTIKSIFALKYVITCCSDADYVMKSDDDTFVHVPNVIDAASLIGSKSILGYIHTGSSVNRKGKWALSASEYPYEVLPPYMAGAGYVMSYDVTHPLYDAALRVSRIHIDDVFITGILAKVVNVTLKHDERFDIMDHGRMMAEEPCVFHLGVKVIQTGLSAGGMTSLWRALQEVNNTSCT